MTLVGLASVAVVGLVVGSLLSPVAWRVPRGVPLRSSSAADGVRRPAVWRDAAATRMMRRQTPGANVCTIEVAPPALELTTGALFVAFALIFGPSWALPAYLLLAACGILLTVIDLRHRRLPNAVVGPFTMGALLLLTLASAGTGQWHSLWRALISGAALFVVYLVLAVIAPAGLGMGDVKLAGVLGLYLGYISWRALFLGATGAFVLVAVAAIVMLATQGVDRRTQVPFGPAMVAAAVITIGLLAGGTH